MTISNFQLVAINSMIQGDAFAAPNVTVNLTQFNNSGVVESYSNVYTFGNLAFTNGNITANSWASLQTLGANSFPVFFGTTPKQYIQNLNSGPLLAKVIQRIANLFPANAAPSTIVQTISTAYSTARQKSDLVQSAATATFGSQHNSVYFSTGGLSSLAGNNTSTGLQTVGQSVAQLGKLINFQNPASSFSAIGILSQLIQDGAIHIGNLHVNFFNRPIVDPTSGQIILVTPAFILKISNSTTQSPTNQNTYPMLAFNKYEAPIRALLDDALSATSDLAAILTYVGVAQPAPTATQLASGVVSTPLATYSPVINKFSDCLDVENMLGHQAAASIKTGAGFSTPSRLTTDVFVTGILTNVKSSQNITNSAAFGNALVNLDLLSTAPAVVALTTPLATSDVANISNIVGSGSGSNNSITVSDILGSTNINDALATAVIGLQQLASIANAAVMQNIRHDTANLAIGLSSTISVTGIGLSNGTLYYTPDQLVGNAVPLIEINAANLAATTTTANLMPYFIGYNTLAQTHNNSIGFANNANNVASIVGFATQLPNQTSNPNGILDVIGPLLTPGLAGQSILAVLSDAKNQQILNNLGVTKETQEAAPTVDQVSTVVPAIPMAF